MKQIKKYQCIGYSFASDNDYLLGAIGEIHTREGWLKRIFPTRYEFAIEYFNGWSDKELFDYILKNLRIRIKKVG